MAVVHARPVKLGGSKVRMVQLSASAAQHTPIRHQRVQITQPAGATQDTLTVANFAQRAKLAPISSSLAPSRAQLAQRENTRRTQGQDLALRVVPIQIHPLAVIVQLTVDASRGSPVTTEAPARSAMPARTRLRQEMMRALGVLRANIRRISERSLRPLA